MSTGFFGDIKKIRYEGPDSTNPLAYRFYDKDEMVAGKRMEDHLRFSVAYWHSFAWPGGDPFGGQTFERPWFGEDMDKAKLKADVAFEMFSLLGAPFYCFHDADVRPEGATFAESLDNLNRIVDIFAISESSAAPQRRPASASPVKAFAGGARGLQDKLKTVAKSYLSHGNAAIAKDWSEF